MNEATLLFVHRHRHDNVSRLALSAHGRTDIDLPWALQQIAGWQKTGEKIPSWSTVEGMLFPPHLNLEQCSSETTARYKAGLAKRLTATHDATLIDLTGGFGVDFAFMARHFTKATYVERNPMLCDLARHNFPLLGLPHAEVVCADANDYSQNTESFFRHPVFYLDPARRDEQGHKTYAISDCTPDILSLAPQLLQHADYVVVKLSPMLDWHKAADDIQTVANNAVREVHILSVKNECKELLLVLSIRHDTPLTLHCINDEQQFVVSEATHKRQPATSIPQIPNHIHQIFLPNASVMKAGVFNELVAHFNLQQLAPSSHLFLPTDDTPSDITFPGKIFNVVTTTSMNRRDMKKALQGITRANISVRNFPLTAAELRQRLHIADGGPYHIFGTTLADNTHILLVCLPH